MKEIYSYLTTTQNYFIGCAVVVVLCLIMLFREKTDLRKENKKTSITAGDIIIYIMLTCFSWIGVIIATILAFITNTEWLNKPIIRL